MQEVSGRMSARRARLARGAGLVGRARIGWFLLFVWLNQTNQMNPSQLSNEHFLISYISL